MSGTASQQNSVERAELSRGMSGQHLYALLERQLTARGAWGATLIDVGCGRGDLFRHVRNNCGQYTGLDLVAYPEFPREAKFLQADLNSGRLPLPDRYADITVSLETIEHLENPRGYFRELVRVTKNYLVVSTPNQLNIHSKLTLLFKNEFTHFQEPSYPAHISALLEIDLVRMARENNLQDIEVFYSERGRIPFTPWHWPRGFGGRAFSENVFLIAKRPA